MKHFTGPRKKEQRSSGEIPHDLNMKALGVSHVRSPGVSLIGDHAALQYPSNAPTQVTCNVVIVSERIMQVIRRLHSSFLYTVRGVNPPGENQTVSFDQCDACARKQTT